jgi:hypothetical protein
VVHETSLVITGILSFWLSSSKSVCLPPQHWQKRLPLLHELKQNSVSWRKCSTLSQGSEFWLDFPILPTPGVSVPLWNPVVTPNFPPCDEPGPLGRRGLPIKASFYQMNGWRFQKLMLKATLWQVLTITVHPVTLKHLTSWESMPPNVARRSTVTS